MTQLSHAPTTRDLNLAIFAGCMVAFIGFGFAASFGVFLEAISDDLGWKREVFSLSLAVQALCWGLTQPFAGAVADKRGAAGVLAFGAICSAAGFLIRAMTADPTIFVASGVLTGIGTGACAFPVVIIALGKVVTLERRSFIMGLGTAAASLGMFVAAPASVWLMEALTWRPAVMVIAASFILILPFIFLIARVSVGTASGGGVAGYNHAIRSAFRDRSYVCLFVGFFVCGFHVTFIQTHLPAYISDKGFVAGVGAAALALIGLFNIAGSFGSGWLGKHASMKLSLSAIYLLRALVISIFILSPLSEYGVYLFAAAMGVLWLSTVPLTTGLVARTQGLTYLSTLAGLVFLSHQVGAFLGAWLGGRIYDAFQDYAAVWWIAVALGLFAALIHLPIRDRPAEGLA